MSPANESYAAGFEDAKRACELVFAERLRLALRLKEKETARECAQLCRLRFRNELSILNAVAANSCADGIDACFGTGKWDEGKVIHEGRKL